MPTPYDPLTAYHPRYAAYPFMPSPTFAHSSRCPIIQTAQPRRPAYEPRDDPSNQSLPISNPVSGFAIWKLKSAGQRLTRKMRLRSPDNEKVGSQRLAASPLSGGNYATIFSAGTWLTETSLSGWGDRTRTRKCRFNINASAALDLPGRTN